jgi:formate-dependent nitrite reductase membrane component NrfD
VKLIPHFIKRVSLREHKPWISGLTASAVLLGGFILRMVIVYAGQTAKVIA